MVTKRDIIDLRKRMFEGYGKGNEGNARIDFNIYLGNYLPEAEMWDPLPKDHEFDREIRENYIKLENMVNEAFGKPEKQTG